MTRRRAAPLDMLVAGLGGRPLAGTDWDAVIALANHTLLTPTLCAALRSAGELDRLPADAADFLAFIHDRNHTRNLRLRDQLGEAVAALNRRRITPILLKGAVPLFAPADDRLPTRMTSDLDIGVRAAHLPAARDCLLRLGYAAEPGAREFARVGDSGVVDLRESTVSGVETERAGLRAVIPTPEARALHWILHDLVKEGDYWRGRIDLRHLRDLAELAEGGLDWSLVRAAGVDRTTRNAIDTQFVTLARLFGSAVPGDAARPITRLQHARRVFTARHRVIGAPLRLIGHLAWVAHRVQRSDDLVARGAADLARRAARTLRDSRSKI